MATRICSIYNTVSGFHSYCDSPVFWCSVLTTDGLNVWHVQIATGGKGSQEGSNISSTLEAFGRLLVALPVINLQIHQRAKKKPQSVIQP